MKPKVLFLAVFISMTSLLSNTNMSIAAQSVQKNDIFNIYQAYDKAQKTNRPIYYVVASASCSHCYKYMKETIEPNFNKINRDFIFAFSDLSKGDKVPSNLIFNGTTPTTYILNPDGNSIISPIEGAFDSSYLNMLLNKLYSAFSQ